MYGKVLQTQEPVFESPVPMLKLGMLGQCWDGGAWRQAGPRGLWASQSSQCTVWLKWHARHLSILVQHTKGVHHTPKKPVLGWPSGPQTVCSDLSLLLSFQIMPFLCLSFLFSGEQINWIWQHCSLCGKSEKERPRKYPSVWQESQLVALLLAVAAGGCLGCGTPSLWLFFAS